MSCLQRPWLRRSLSDCGLRERWRNGTCCNGALVGTVAMLMYVVIGLGQPEPLPYIIAYALKVVGGTAGGFVALKRASANAVSKALA
jgi:hypothetical protein